MNTQWAASFVTPVSQSINPESSYSQRPANNRLPFGPRRIKETAMRNHYRNVQIIVLLTVTLAAFSCRTQEDVPSATAEQSTKAPGPLEGVWREAEIVVTGANPSSIPNPQPSLYIFTSAHYAMLGTVGDKPRQLHKALDATNDEKIAAYNSFFGNAGTYEVAGDTVTIRPVVARMPNFMAGGSQKLQFRLDGETLWLTGKSTDDYYRLGEQVVPDPRPLSETRTKLVKVR
jgi:hypothetical protein